MTNWINKLEDKQNNQDSMIVLNECHKGRAIFIEDNDCEILDSSYIKNKDNKLYWRHQYSYLNEDLNQYINQMIYTDIMKNKVLAIPRHILYFAKYEFYEHHTSESARVVMPIRKCCFNTKKETRCSRWGYKEIKLDDNLYSIKFGGAEQPVYRRDIPCCKTHLNKYNKLNDKGKKEKINQALSMYDLHLRNGVICRSSSDRGCVSLTVDSSRWPIRTSHTETIRVYC